MNQHVKTAIEKPGKTLWE